MTSPTPTDIPADVATSRHRVRLTFATIFGGAGVALLGLGLIALVLMSFVSSPAAAKSTTQRVLNQPEVRNYLVEEIAKEIEDKANPVEKIVLKFARMKISTALLNVLAKPEIQNSVGDAVAKAYTVYVDNEPAAEIDISPISRAVVAAVIGTDKRLRLADNLELDPIKITRDDNDFNYGALRDLLRLGSWLLVALGILLQAAAWFLSVASQRQRILRLGVRLFVGGVIFLGIVLVVRSKVSQTSSENKAVLEAVAQLITDPMVARFLILLVLGLIIGSVGFVMKCKEAPTVS